MATLVDISVAGTIETKQEKLLNLLRGMDRVIVAYSGGTDSAYLAWAAKQALGNEAVAITADSASIPESHKRDAETFAREFGIRHEYVETREFENPDYVKNDANRCFHCKDELFTALEKIAWSECAAGGCGSHESRDSRTVAQSGTVDLGSARGGVSEFADSLRYAGDDREHSDRRSG
jgi:PP-loop superfamily ATP-utilizing enzyme